MRPSVRMIAVEQQEASADIAGRLGVDAGTAVVYRCRDCLADDVTVQRQEAWHPLSVAYGSALMQPEAVKGGIFGELTRIGHRPATITEEVSARPPTRGEAQLLTMPLRTPVLVVERITRDTAGRVLEYLRVTSAGDRSTLVYEDLTV